jgi:hypothetical protein
VNQRDVWICREGYTRLQGSIYPEQRSAPRMSADRMQASSEEQAHPSNWIRC